MAELIPKLPISPFQPTDVPSREAAGGNVAQDPRHQHSSPQPRQEPQASHHQTTSHQEDGQNSHSDGRQSTGGAAQRMSLARVTTYVPSSVSESVPVKVPPPPPPQLEQRVHQPPQHPTEQPRPRRFDGSSFTRHVPPEVQQLVDSIYSLNTEEDLTRVLVPQSQLAWLVSGFVMARSAQYSGPSAETIKTLVDLNTKLQQFQSSQSDSTPSSAVSTPQIPSTTQSSAASTQIGQRAATDTTPVTSSAQNTKTHTPATTGIPEVEVQPESAPALERVESPEPVDSTMDSDSDVFSSVHSRLRQHTDRHYPLEDIDEYYESFLQRFSGDVTGILELTGIDYESKRFKQFLKENTVAAGPTRRSGNETYGEKFFRDFRNSRTQSRGIGFLKTMTDGQSRYIGELTAILNKIVPANYAENLEEIRSLIRSALKDSGDARPFIYQAVSIITTKACLERSFIILYAFLCQDLCVCDSTNTELQVPVTDPEKRGVIVKSERERFDRNEGMPLRVSRHLRSIEMSSSSEGEARRARDKIWSEIYCPKFGPELQCNIFIRNALESFVNQCFLDTRDQLLAEHKTRDQQPAYDEWFREIPRIAVTPGLKADELEERLSRRCSFMCGLMQFVAMNILLGNMSPRLIAEVLNKIFFEVHPKCAQAQRLAACQNDPDALIYQSIEYTITFVTSLTLMAKQKAISIESVMKPQELHLWKAFHKCMEYFADNPGSIPSRTRFLCMDIKDLTTNGYNNKSVQPLFRKLNLDVFNLQRPSASTAPTPRVMSPVSSRAVSRNIRACPLRIFKERGGNASTFLRGLVANEAIIEDLIHGRVSEQLAHSFSSIAGDKATFIHVILALLRSSVLHLFTHSQSMDIAVYALLHELETYSQEEIQTFCATVFAELKKAAGGRFDSLLIDALGLLADQQYVSALAFNPAQQKTQLPDGYIYGLFSEINPASVEAVTKFVGVLFQARFGLPLLKQMVRSRPQLERIMVQTWARVRSAYLHSSCANESHSVVFGLSKDLIHGDTSLSAAFMSGLSEADRKVLASYASVQKRGSPGADGGRRVSNQKKSTGNYKNSERRSNLQRTTDQSWQLWI